MEVERPWTWHQEAEGEITGQWRVRNIEKVLYRSFSDVEPLHLRKWSIEANSWWWASTTVPVLKMLMSFLIRRRFPKKSGSIQQVSGNGFLKNLIRLHLYTNYSLPHTYQLIAASAGLL